MNGKSILFILYGCTYGALALAQENCKAKAFFEQRHNFGNQHAGKKCVQLDANHSVDKQGMPLAYRWDMGDGTIKKGAKVTHCYARYGSYYVTLDLIDEESGMVMENEWTTKIVLQASFHQEIDTVNTGGTTAFRYWKTQMPYLADPTIFWRIDDKLYCGNQVKHIFTKQGLHWVEMGLLEDIQQGRQIRGLGLKGVFVTSKTD